MTDIKERFLSYAVLPTNSDENNAACPSSEKQRVLLKKLQKDCLDGGLTDVTLTDEGYLYATLDETVPGAPVIGLISHVDTSPDMSDNGISPWIFKQYDGTDVVLNEKQNIVMRTADFPMLLNYLGDDLIFTDGTTLLGADDKAGVAAILDAVIRLKESGVPHGKIRIGFTPDEEIGRGADRFDVPFFGADYAYTVDGGAIGEIEYENFNAASASIVIAGESIHPGSAKNKMINALQIACELNALLPSAMRPEHTEKYEGFFHLTNLNGSVEQAKMHYIIRDHDKTLFEEKKQTMARCVEFINQTYQKTVIECTITDSYYNMREKIEPHMAIIDRLEKAMRAVGVEPIVQPIRGGTDGARLSYMGLPCPNICTGGENFHGKYEFISVQKLQKTSDILFQLLADAAKIGH